MKYLLLLMVIILLAAPCAGIEVYSENPFYWSRDGKPILLLGGSGDDNLFQWAGAEFGDKLSEHLDLLVSVGGNYVRNTMSSRFDAVNGYNDAHMAYPFKKLASGKYDLDQWNDDYWRRLDTFLKETHKRTIFVQLEIWDLWATVGHVPWSKQPWNPDNNVNYTYDNTTLKRGASGDKQPFFHAVAGDTLDPVVKHYQDRFVGKIMEVTLRYDHVLYQIDNESSFAYEISDYWARFVHSQAARHGRTVYVCDSRRFRSPSPYVTENFCDWDNPDVHHPILHQELYNYCDIAQNGGNIGQTHYDNLVWYRARLLEHSPRPINHVKIYKFIWPTGTSWHSRSEPDETIHATQRFWRTIFAGAAGARHHRNKGNWGLGLESRAQADIKSMRMLTNAMNIFTMTPDNSLLGKRGENEAYAIAEAGSQYAVYLTGEADHSVKIDLTKAKMPLTQRWLDIERSQWATPTTIAGGTRHTITTPGPGQWAVLIKKIEPCTAPANPNASAAARAVLEYFHGLPNKPDKRIVSGQFLDHGANASLDEIAEAHKKSGRWVGMIGGDYYGGGPSLGPDSFYKDPQWTQDANWAETNPLLIDYWKRGGLVTLCLHAPNPQTGNSSWLNKHKDTINLTDVVTPGRPGYDAWMHQLDCVARGLQELEDEGVVVLFRPFHEMNGFWFWWGSMNTPAEFVKLWRHTFDYLTHTKKLDNLLWVYSASARSDCLDFYPGNEYVDMVGVDSYGKTMAQIRKDGYSQLVALGKPFGLTEFGPYKQLNWAKDPRNDYDYGRFIRELAEQMPLCTSFVVWHQYHGLQFQQNAAQCLGHPWAVNRSDLPGFGR